MIIDFNSELIVLYSGPTFVISLFICKQVTIVLEQATIVLGLLREKAPQVTIVLDQATIVLGLLRGKAPQVTMYFLSQIETLSIR